MDSIFSPIQVGRYQLAHRIAYGPMTRFRASDDHVHGPLAVEHYAQRGTVPGTLLITEATFISPRCSGYPNVPGIWNQAQIDAWKKVTDAVHKKGSYIFVQLWALGRAATPEVMAEGTGRDGIVSSSALPIEEGRLVPRALSEEEIWSYIGDYVQAAKNSIEAGFDGVEIHAANGYLIDQFTQDTCNKRIDAWGGSIEKRARFGIEVAKACVVAIGADRVGIRLSPFSPYQAMKMEDPVAQFSYLIGQLKQLKLAYLHLIESRISGAADIEGVEKLHFALKVWGNTSPVLVCGGYTAKTAKRAVETDYKGYDVIVAFGRYFISTPDLPFRMQQGIEFNKYNRETFYTKGPEGYIDYPFSKEFEAVSEYKPNL